MIEIRGGDLAIQKHDADAVGLPRGNHRQGLLVASPRRGVIALCRGVRKGRLIRRLGPILRAVLAGAWHPAPHHPAPLLR